MELIIWKQWYTLPFHRPISSCGWATRRPKNYQLQQNVCNKSCDPSPHLQKELGKQLNLAGCPEGRHLNLRLSCTRAVKAGVPHTSSCSPWCDRLPFSFDVVPSACLTALCPLRLLRNLFIYEKKKKKDQLTVAPLQIPDGLGRDALIDSRDQPSLSSMSFCQASKETDVGGVQFYNFYS